MPAVRKTSKLWLFLKLLAVYQNISVLNPSCAYSSYMINIIDSNLCILHLVQKRREMQSSQSNKAFEHWLTLLRISIGIIYIWFGVLKFFPGVSPAEELAKETIHLLTFRLIKPDLSLLLLAIWETSIGVLLALGVYIRLVIRIVLLHMICTFAPLFLLPALSFTAAPFALTLVGQYIIKNIVIISALFVIDTSAKSRR